MARLVILGSGGRLGAALARVYGGEFDVVAFSRAEVDLASSESIEKHLGPLGFDVLINCAALTNVDYCETHEEEAMRINAEAVGEVAQLCERKQARLVHISTDYVFEGTKTTPYSEEDPAVAISVYGESKLRGEQALLAVSDRHLAVRVSWVFGPDRPSFIDGILKRAEAEEHIDAIADKYSTPAYTVDIADYLRPLLFDVPAGGLLHICDAGECSWQEYGQFALDCAARAGAALKGTRVEPLKLQDLKAFVAKRPVYTVLSTGKLTRLTGLKPRPWQEAVESYIATKYA